MCVECEYDEYIDVYDSPIKVIQEDYRKKVEEMIEDNVFKVTSKFGIDINEAELIAALQADRKRYEEAYNRGYSAGWGRGFNAGLKACEEGSEDEYEEDLDEN